MPVPTIRAHNTDRIETQSVHGMVEGISVQSPQVAESAMSSALNTAALIIYTNLRPS